MRNGDKHSKCLMLHSYELGILPERDETEFEEHLLSCETCVTALETASEEMAILKRDIDYSAVKDSMHKSTANSQKAPKLRKWLLPDNPWFLQPATLTLLVLLLLTPAFIGIQHFLQPSKIEAVQAINLNATRSLSENTFTLKNDTDVLISFICPDIQVDQVYYLLLRNHEGDVIFEDRQFDDFDKYKIGQLLIPYKRIASGVYSLRVLSGENEELHRFEFSMQKNE